MHTSTGTATAPPARRVFCALLIGMLMAQLDTTIVVAALPSVTDDLASGGAVAGVTAAYLLTVTVSTPVHGTLGDLLGRRAVFRGALALFALGSVACALAPTLPALTAARALQGLGGGGLVVTAISALAQLFGRQEMVRRQGYLTGVLAVSTLAGPPLGGLLAAGPGWRWIFLVNLPLCALAALLAADGLPGRAGRAAGGPRLRFDVAGTALVTLVGVGVVALGASESLARGPGAVVVLAVVLGCAAAFVAVERRSAAPLIPPALFADPGVARSVASTALAGTALFGAFTFVPLAVQRGTGVGAGAIGLLLLALTGGQLLATVAFSVLARRYAVLPDWGRLALVMGAVGMAGLAVLPVSSGDGGVLALGLAGGGMALTGAALGLSLQAYTLLAQGRARPDLIGATMGTLAFARQLGGSLGTAAFGWVVLAAPSERAGLTLALGVAAGCLVAALLVAPRRRDDPSGAGDDGERRG
ncbi:MFS transporter [Streptomyces hainanensis]|uniref:MFS transporter n=1 Tax=Streptomyces hainanensis TaxID=402648 RepID=A0A4R4THR5_9ACTN|nr:MFS transporter [Streptomyces hainanensis]TDC74503.1 MFS transporter [Streptomyces hainanensis]